MNLIASLAFMAVGFVATVTAPAGPPLALAVLVLGCAGLWVADALADRFIP